MTRYLIVAWLAALQISRGGAFASSFKATARSLSAIHNAPSGTSSRQKQFKILRTTADDNSQHDDDDQQQQPLSTRGGAEEEQQDQVEDATTSLLSGNTITETIPANPRLSEYIKFALPCLGLWIAGPLLSLVDTSFVGLSGTPQTSARQLAALGPATTFMDGATYLFAFLNVATTNLYSSARAASGHANDPKVEDAAEIEPDLAAESVVRTAARVSLRCGLGIMFFLLLTCKPLLRLYIGEEAAKTPGLLKSASDYVMIRSLHMPTSLLLGVLQSALLGAKDSVTPLIAIVYSTIVNVCGDYLLVSKLKMGLPGAAIATTCAQWAATAALLGPARRELVHDHNLGIFFKPRDDQYTNKDGSQPTDMVTSKSFLGFAAPVLTLIMGKLAAFGFMTNAAAGVPGQPTPLASHQIILSLLFFCSPFLEVISQTAQTFLPPFLAPIRKFMERNNVSPAEAEDMETVKPWLKASGVVSATLLGCGFLAGAGIASLVCLVPAFNGGLLTSDTTVQQAVKPLAKYLWLGAFAWAPVAVGEGILLAQRHLGFLAIIYLLSTAMLPPALFMIKLRKGSVEQIWFLFGLFQIFRAVCFTGRIWWGPFLMKKLFKKNKTAQAAPATA
eukprot:CAMPEP_0168752474 /NCGR_PEP_ID=MMETSP0724-20121128/18405_1 /TAXON_ID=265536 /ORGANISM="Amphiprora sp., Strain CCMP467" /LENGTH=616 /DNA_ID=CAMNT_0008800725 /DNA_START=9 /DNA_END=1859 /DNA_ORIENTATION=-